MGRPEVRVVILYEDQEHECFLRHLAKRLNLRPLRFENCRNNAGVLQKLREEVEALRERSYQKNLGLIVVIDADALGFAGRLAEVLARIAQDTGLARGDVERIALVIPAREIEPWYVHLCVPNARPIDEARDYKPSPEWRELAKDVGAAAKRAVAAWGPDPARVDPASLCAAREELSRVT